MNLTSNNSLFDTSSNHLEKFIAPQILEQIQCSNIHKTQNNDPIINLLEDIKTRKVKIIIPTREDDSSSNETTSSKSLFIKVNLKKKFFPIDKPVKIPKIFKNQRSPEFPTLAQKILLQKLKNVPVYVVVTKKDEMVMAVSREPKDNNLLSWVQEKYYNAFVWKEDRGPISLGLFFMNKQDAQLYLHDIGAANPQMAEKAELQVKMVGLDTFYRLNRISPPGQQTKLIADLAEILELSRFYNLGKPLAYNPGQRYGRTHYKGTPIYIMKPSVVKKENTQADFLPYNVKKNEKAQEYIFFKLKDAFLAWDEICEKQKNLYRPLYPKIEVYNLENYLRDLELNYEEAIKTRSFILTTNSFEELQLQNEAKKKIKHVSRSKKIKKIALEKLTELHSFSKKILWVLTSDTLPTEKNAW